MKSFIKQLSRAIEEKDTTQVKVVLQYHTVNLDLECLNENGRTLLQECCRKGSLDIIRLLVDHGAKLETVDTLGNTALHHACASGEAQIARFLILNCADVNAINNNDELPINLAEDKSIRLLLEMAMSLKSRDINQIMTLGRIRRRRSFKRYNLSKTISSKPKPTAKIEKVEKNNFLTVPEKSRHRPQKSASFNTDRRNSWTGKLKKFDSFKKDSKIKSKLQKKKGKTLRKVASEADMGNLTQEIATNEATIQKVEPSVNINLVGLSIQ